MRWLVKRITRRHKLGISHEDTTIDHEQITLGRGADADVHLPHLTVALAHARLAVVENRIAVTALARAGITVDNVALRHAEVEVGGSFAIGRYEVRVLDGTTPEEIRLEIEIVSDAEVVEGGTGLGLIDRRPGKRRIAYLAGGAIATVFVLIPLAGMLDPALQSALRKVGVPSDLAWNSGPLANVHRMSRDRCEDCHRHLFERVTDSACVVCHRATRGHVADPIAVDTPAPRCAHCHREHNGDAGFTEFRAQMCTACHGEPLAAGDGRMLAAVKSFSEAHPDFAVTLASDGGAFQRIQLASGPRERPGLAFDHAGHVRQDGVRGPDGKRELTCGDCHEATADGRAFRPVSMTRHCEACHRLEFDAAGSASLPHAEVPEVMKTLQEYYARRALEGGYSGYAPPVASRESPARAAEPPVAPNAVFARRRPGEPLEEPDRLAALAWADATAAFVGEEMVRYRSCVTCHALQAVAGSAAPRIEPLKIVTDWMPAATFDHGRHATIACSDCHAAEASDDSADVLMPDVDTCRACHGDTGASRHEVATVCVDCHRYHLHSAGATAQPVR